MEKRGESLIQEFIYFSFRLFLLIVVVVVILAIFNMYMVEEPEVLDQETFIINQRLMRSPTCFAYEKNGRVFPGIIDVDKLENSRIQECMILEEKKGFNVTLLRILEVGNNYENETVTSFMVNDPLKAFIELCDTNQNIQYKCSSRIDYVLIKDGDKLDRGILRLVVAERD